MLCSKCKKREARIYCTEIIQGIKREQFLCQECAAEYASFQMEQEGFYNESGLGELLSGILGSAEKGQVSREEPVEDITCANCGMTYQEFLQLGKFGCAGCYKSFGRFLGKSFKQIQGGEIHTGKRPAGYISSMDKAVRNIGEIEKLGLKLQEAIEKEEFEEAAKLRDQIREQKAAKESGEEARASKQQEVPHA